MYEKSNQTKTGLTTSAMVKAALLSVISVIIMLFETPLPLMPPFLQFDFSELPGIFGSFALGPVFGIWVCFLKNLLVLLIKGTRTGGVGELANFIIGSSFVVVAGLLFQRLKGSGKVFWAGLFGSLGMTLAGSLMNYFLLLPAYAKVGFATEQVVAISKVINPLIYNKFTLVLFGIAPFNLLKGLLLTFVSALLYPRMSRFLDPRAGVKP